MNTNKQTISSNSLEVIINSINSMHVLTNIPISIVDYNGTTLYCLPESVHHFIPIRYAKEFIYTFISHAEDKNIPFMLFRESGTMMGVILLPTNDYLIVGPILNNSSVNAITMEFLTYKLKEDEFRSVKRVLNEIPPMDAVRFANLLSNLIFGIRSINILPVEILMKSFSSEGTNANPASDNNTAFQNYIEQSDISLIFENKIVSAVKSGNIHALSEVWKYPAPAEMKTLPDNMPFYLFYDIPLLSLTSRAAIEGGADPYEVMKIFHKALVHINSLTIPGSSLIYTIEITRDFCNLVRKAAGKEMQPEICKECEQYINAHISEKITVDQLSKFCGVSKRKLYTIFEANFNMTINEYITRERLRRAMILLESSNYTMAEISSSLGYATQSYFITVFEKYYNCTPGEYIKKKRKLL